MLNLAITWLPIIGGVIFGLGVTIWYGAGNKSYAIWMGLFGAIILAVGCSLHLQKIVWDSDTQTVSPSETEIHKMCAYVFVEASEIHNFGTNRPVEGWISLRNSGVTPATELRRWATIFATKFPHNEFERAPFGNSRSILGPGAAVDFAPITMSRALTADEIAAVTSGIMAIYIFGEIRYLDVFKIERCTNFRLMFRGNGSLPSGRGLALQQLEDGNSDDCPN